jgi:flagellar hook-length control protein FliK
LERLLNEGRPKEQTMQEVSATKTIADRFDQLRTSALVDTSSQARAFSDFLGLLSQSSQNSFTSTGTSSSSAQDLTPYLGAGQQIDTSAGTSTLVQTTATAQSQSAAQTASTSSTTTSATRQTSSENLAARNTPVTRESFEEARPLLAKAGLSDREIEELSAKAQAGTLTWGQMVQAMGGHMSGGKQSVSLSDSDKLNLQTMFQKLGFAQDASTKLVQSMADGDGQKVLASVQSKLSGMDGDSTPGLDKGEIASFLKGLGVPQATAAKLTATLGENSTATQLKTAFANGEQALQELLAKKSGEDTQTAKQLGAIMEKDVTKSARDTNSSADVTAGSSTPKVAFELKTKDRDDTSFFTQHEKNQQQKSSSDSWRDFVSKVRTDDSTAQNAAAQQTASAKSTATDALGSTRAAGLAAQTTTQTTAQTTTQAKAFDKVQAPKVLDQVTEAMLKDLGQGRKQLSITLDPEDLGKVQVMLQVKGKEVNAVIHAESADTATMLSSQLSSIRKSLEEQGLTVQNLDVQTGLASGQQQQQYYNAEEHNQAQERQEMSKLMSQLRLLRSDSTDMAQDMQSIDVQAIFSDRSLHLIA